MAWTLCHAEFVVSAPGPAAFRRDRVPLDADRMAALSDELTTMARAQSMATPAASRTVAQLLALALALDPGNAESRELMASCRKGSHTPLDDPEGRTRSLAIIGEHVEWLKLPEAGSDGHALAACLTDVAAAAGSAETPLPGETGAWTGWVPGLPAYEPRPALAETKAHEILPPPEPGNKVRPAPKLTQAAIDMLAWKKSGKDSTAIWLPAPSTLNMAASATEEPDAPFAIRIFPSDGRTEETARMLGQLMRNHHGESPQDIRVRISCRDFREPVWDEDQQRRPLAFSAAAAVLVSAAITGREPDAVVLGEVDANGTYTLPAALWDQLLALGPGNGKRLILPARAAGLLPSLLATGKPGFFMNYEVLLARDFADLLDLSAKQPPETVAAASAKFRTIRERMGNQDVRSYVANRYVRPRLGELAQEAPYHASAAMLNIQASGQRPTMISRMALNSELLRNCSTISWIILTKDRDLDAAEEDMLDESVENYRKRIDELADLAAKTDQDLMESARLLIQPLRDMERALRARGEYYEKMAAMWKARNNFNELYSELGKNLADEARKLMEP